jgi:hypothetical protein
MNSASYKRAVRRQLFNSTSIHIPNSFPIAEFLYFDILFRLQEVLDAGATGKILTASTWRSIL